MPTKKKSSRKNIRWIAVVIALLAVSGLAYTFLLPQTGLKLGRAQATPTSTYQTSIVRRGSLAETVSGSGKLAATQSADLSFPVSGKVAQVNVQVGDTVNAGQTLAVLDNVEQLQLAVANAQLALQIAQDALNAYTTSSDANLAQGLADQAKAQAAYQTALQNVHKKGAPRCDPSLTEQYYYTLLDAQTKVNQWEKYLDDPHTGYGHDYLIQILTPLWYARDIANANYVYCQSYTDQEVAASQAALQTAKAAVQTAQQAYQTLQANNGLDPNTVALDQLTVKNAQAQLAKAQNDLAGSTLVSPIDGTVMAVNGESGQASGNTTFATVTDMLNPQVNVNIDESDLGGFAVGCSAQVSFDTIPGKTFAGTVAQVLPVLATSNNSTSVQGVVTLKDTPELGGQPLPVGTNANIAVTCSQAADALQVPIQAIHQQAGQPDYVYVLNQQGQPEKRTVQIGIQTSAFVEITSGLNQGERVITAGPNLK